MVRLEGLSRPHLQIGRGAEPRPLGDVAGGRHLLEASHGAQAAAARVVGRRRSLVVETLRFLVLCLSFFAFFFFLYLFFIGFSFLLFNYLSFFLSFLVVCLSFFAFLFVL